jgi:integrase
MAAPLRDTCFHMGDDFSAFRAKRELSGVYPVRRTGLHRTRGWARAAQHLAPALLGSRRAQGGARTPPSTRPAAHGDGLVDGRRGEPEEVSARAGHTSVSFTLDRYGHLLPGTEQRLNDALDAPAEGTLATAEVLPRCLRDTTARRPPRPH